MVNFDPTIKLGDVLTVIAFLGVGIGAFYNIKAKIAAIASSLDLTVTTSELRFKHIDETLTETKRIMSNSQTQDAQLLQLRREVDELWKQFNSLRDRLEELRHWKGFVNPDGEYRRDATPKIPV